MTKRYHLYMLVLSPDGKSFGKIPHGEYETKEKARETAEKELGGNAWLIEECRRVAMSPGLKKRLAA